MLKLCANHPDLVKATKLGIVRDHGGLVAEFDDADELNAFLRCQRLILRGSPDGPYFEVVSLDLVAGDETDLDEDVPA